MTYAPAHHFVLVDRPGKYRPVPPAHLVDEALAEGPDEKCLLYDVEGDILARDEAAGIEGGEADVGDREGGQIVFAKDEVFYLRVRFRSWKDAESGQLTAQIPITIRWFQLRNGLDWTDSIVSAISRITASESLSS